MFNEKPDGETCALSLALRTRARTDTPGHTWSPVCNRSCQNVDSQTSHRPWEAASCGRSGEHGAEAGPLCGYPAPTLNSAAVCLLCTRNTQNWKRHALTTGSRVGQTTSTTLEPGWRSSPRGSPPGGLDTAPCWPCRSGVRLCAGAVRTQLRCPRSLRRGQGRARTVTRNRRVQWPQATRPPARSVGTRDTSELSRDPVVSSLW